MRTSPPRHSRTPERELHPVTQRANHSEGAKNPPTFPAPCQVEGPRTSRPQGFNYYVYAKSAPSEVSGLVFHGVPKSARSTKIDRLLELLEWWLQLAIQLRGSSMPNDISPVFDNFQPHARLSLHTFESISKVQFSDFIVISTSVSS